MILEANQKILKVIQQWKKRNADIDEIKTIEDTGSVQTATKLVKRLKLD